MMEIKKKKNMILEMKNPFNGISKLGVAQGRLNKWKGKSIKITQTEIKIGKKKVGKTDRQNTSGTIMVV